MLERWIVASLIIGALIAGRVLLRRYVVPVGSRGCASAADNCLTSGCKTLRSSLETENEKESGQTSFSERTT